MKVEKFMTADPLVLDTDNSLWETARLFTKNKIDGAPVVKNGQMVGLLTKTHLVRAIVDRIDMECPIKDYMTKQVKYLHPEQDIRDVDIFYTGRYPVVKNNQVIGFLTKSDIMVALKSIIDELAGQMETVINSAYNPIVAIDCQGIIRIWNRAAERYTGLPRSDVLGSFINDAIPESHLFDIIRSKKCEYGIKIRVGDTSFITNRAPIINNGEVTGAVAVLYDTSELEKVTRELAYVKSLNAELDAIIDSSYDGLYITDGEGLTLRINQAIKRMTGLGEEELVNKTMYELVDQGILSRSASILVLEQRKSITITLSTVTGTNLLVSATPVFDEDGNIFRIVTSVRDVSELNMLKQRVEQLEGLNAHFEFQMKQMQVQLSGEMVFKNPEMENLIYQSMKIAEVDSTVLISGESGVGKERIAEIIQCHSTRKTGPFIKVNCTAIPENLIESELFGYEGGSFTGARKEGKPGLFELAHEGTLLLDEIGDIPLHLQVKLLRAIQEREIFRVGGTKPIHIDVRIIAITNKSLEQMVKQGDFREDLYYRLNVIPIHVPSLRDRLEDIPLLVRHFLIHFNQRYNYRKEIEPEVYEVLMQYNWPGNIRELENLIERLVVTSSAEKIGLNQLPSYLFNTKDTFNDNDGPVTVNRIIPLKNAVEYVEKTMLEKTFMITDSYYKAAQILGVDASTVSRKARKYQVFPKG
ncbi:MAG: sigma 54-interacting transcriptional regulator [Syntrophomonadaceae bacterium]|jgi:PAS domain S-box-containing protein|nr:sigma 54-interacting transcriptional regulator [Syntrophomonadaceae bacterium]